MAKWLIAVGLFTWAGVASAQLSAATNPAEVRRPVSPEFRPTAEVHLRAGTRARVDPGTRCYFEDRGGVFLEAVAHEGAWFCEQPGSSD